MATMNRDAPRNRAGSLLEALARLPVWATLLIAASVMAALAGIDLVTGDEISFSIFYLAPILYVTWCAGFRWGAAAAVVAAATWGVIDFASGARYSSSFIPVWNSVVRLGFFLTSAYILRALQHANERMEALAHTDSLTGVANARSFYAALEREIERQRRYGSAFTVTYIDLDNFKAVNDTCGHSTGDELLRAVSAEVSRSSRAADTVARLGGDEFAVLMPETGQDVAMATAARIHSGVVRLMQASAHDVPGAGATAGVVVFESPPESGDAAVNVADGLMYNGKALGRGVVQLVVWRQPGRTEPLRPTDATPLS